MSDKTFHHSSSEPEDRGIAPSDLLEAIIKHKTIVALSIMIFFFFSAIYGHYKTPIYQVDATLEYLSSGSNSLNTILADMPSIGSGKEINTQIGIIKSRDILLNIIEQFNLSTHVSARYFPVVGKYIAHKYNLQHNDSPAPSKFGLSKYSWGGDSIELTKFDVPAAWQGKNFTLKTTSKNTYTVLYPNGEKLLSGSVGVVADKTLENGETISLFISKLNARKNTEFDLINYPNYQLLGTLNSQLSVTTDGNSSDLIRIKYTTPNYTTGKEVVNAISQLAITKTAGINAQQAAQTLSFLKTQIPKVAEKLKTAQNELASYQEKTGSVEIDEQSKLLIRKLSNITSNILTTEAHKERLSEQYTPQSYQMEQINNALSDLRNQKSKLEALLATIPTNDQEVINLSRNVEVQQSIYTNLLNQIQTFEILKAGTVSTLVQIDQAYDFPVRIDKPASVITLMGTVFGLFFGVLIAVVLHLSKNTITDAGQIEDITQLQPLGLLYESSIIKKQTYAFKKGLTNHLKFIDEIDHYDITLESLRNLMTSLKLSLSQNKKIISISGPSPNVGKSFIAANLAQVFANNGHKTLLIDGDSRRGHIHNFFSVKHIPGWTDYLENSTCLDDILKNTRINDLSFIPAGSRDRLNYLSLIASNRTTNLLEDLKEEFDVIIIDTPPILGATDASVLFQKSDVNLLAFSHDRHTPSEINATMQILRNVNATIDGFIFNRIRALRHKYGYGYGYGYNYKYRYGTRND